MSTTVYKYNIQCTTENCLVECWGTAAPTKCPNDSSHTVDPDSVTIVQTVADRAITVTVVLDNSGNVSSATASGT